MFSVALIGAGRIGQIHAENIASHAESVLTYVCDVHEPSALELAKKFEAKVASVDDILADKSVDVVVVASATPTHAELSELSIKAGKAVFCEKPIDLNIERVRQCVDVVKQYNGKMMVGFNRRFDPHFSHLHTSLRKGEVGELEMVSITSRDPGALPIEYLKVSGGMFRDMTIHDFDMARFMLGEEPVRVQAVAASLTDPEIKKLGDIDTAIVTLQTASGKIAVISNSRRAAYGYDQRLEVLGSDGSLKVDNVVKSLLVKSTAERVESQKPMHFFLERYWDSYRVEWTHFIEALQGNTELWPSAVDGERALVLAEAAVESLQTGNAVDVQFRA